MSKSENPRIYTKNSEELQVTDIYDEQNDQKMKLVDFYKTSKKICKDLFGAKLERKLFTKNK